jgi:hypothetical protein
MNVPLPISIAQWVLLFGLGVLVIVMYRQLAYVLNLIGVDAEQTGLVIGERAPSFKYTSNVRSTEPLVHSFLPSGHSTLLMFADPGCLSCEHAMVALERVVAATNGLSLRVLVVTDADPELVAVTDSFSATSLELGHVHGDVARRLYRTHLTPFLYGIGPDGAVRSRGVAEREEQISAVLHKMIEGSEIKTSAERDEVGIEV